MADEYHISPVQSDTEKPGGVNSLLSLKISETFLDLLDDRFGAGRIAAKVDAVRALGILLFNDDSAVFRVDTAASQAVLMHFPDIDLGFVDKALDELRALDSYFFLFFGKTGDARKGVPHVNGVGVDQIFERAAWIVGR